MSAPNDPGDGNGSSATPGFDQVVVQLKGLVEKLEGGNLSLEQSLEAFEEGVKLARHGSQILDAAEQRVEILLKEESGGGERVTSFHSGEGGDRSGAK